MQRLHPGSTRTATPFPYPALFRSRCGGTRRARPGIVGDSTPQPCHARHRARARHARRLPHRHARRIPLPGLRSRRPAVSVLRRAHRTPGTRLAPAVTVSALTTLSDSVRRRFECLVITAEARHTSERQLVTNRPGLGTDSTRKVAPG